MRFQVLGPVIAQGDHGPVGLGSARQRAVLAILLTELGRAVAFDQLVDRLWGESPPRRARATLHTYLSRLRAVLKSAGGPALVRHAHSYLLEADPGAVDLHQFRMLSNEARRTGDPDRAASAWSDALELWQGEPFADVDSDWLRAVAAALEAERLAAILDRNDVLLRRGEHRQLLPDLAAAAGEHPLDERLAGQLMLALYRSGRQADALAHYRAVHDRLVNELGSDPGPALRGLHQRVLRQDPALTGAAAEVGGPAEPPAEPPTEPLEATAPVEPAVDPLAQLPADIAGFTGREAALHQLDRHLAESYSTVVVSAIGGSGGIGKTTLAVHWAHRVRDRFPDGQLYLNLRGFDPARRAMRPDEALRALLELLQVPAERIPTTVEAQAGLYRSRLAGSRMLIVLDNARDADQVRPLLPGAPGSMVLVTSRDQLAGLVTAEGARPVRLDTLDGDEAWQLLVNRLGAERVVAEPDAAEEIIAACGGLPLALAIVAARAATCPGFRLAAFAGEVTQARGRLDALAGPDPATDLRTVFSWSYEALRPPAARLFRLLGLHPGPDLSLAAAASLAGAPAPQVRRLLGELTGAHLLTEHVPGRYACHDLVRAYAADLAETDPEPDRHAARERMLDYYLHSAIAADQWLPTGRTPITTTPPRFGAVPERFAGNAEARGGSPRSAESWWRRSSRRSRTGSTGRSRTSPGR